MRIYFSSFIKNKKFKIFLYLLLASIVILMFTLGKNDFQDVNQIKIIRNYYFKDLVENNGIFKGTKCPNRFNLLELNHWNERYSDVIIDRHPNLPKFLTESRNISSSLPDIPSIRWTAEVYQESWRDSPKFLLYSAHFDTRLNSHLIFLDSLSFGDDRLNPYLLSCRVPEPENGTSSYPVAVSLVDQLCQTPTNVLKISSSPIKKNPNSENKDIRVGICGKALFYYNYDFSTRLVEWIEIVKLLGVSKIFLYKTKCHKNVQRVLDFYENEGIVKLITFNYPPPYDQEGTFLRLWSKTKQIAYRSSQNIYITDCLQRNKDDFDYLAVFDCDEIPILKKHDSIPKLLESLMNASNNLRHSYFFKWKTFFQDLNSTTSPLNGTTDRSYVFNHNIRTKLNSKEAYIFETNGKTFHDTNQVVWAQPHRHFHGKSKLAPKVQMKTLSRELAYMGHFTSRNCIKRDYCYNGNMEEETALLPIREKVVQEMNKVLDFLQI